MAKVFKSNLQSTTKTSLEISALLDIDMKAEAEVLKELVEQALNITMEDEINTSNRLADAKKRLAELDEKIQHLSVPIDAQDSDTFVQQLTDLIVAENKVFQARQELRFFKNEQAPVQLDTLDDIFQELATSIDILNSFEESYHVGLLESNDLLYKTQFEITSEIVEVMNNLFEQKRIKIHDELLNLSDIYANITQLETDFYRFAEENISQFSNIQKESTAYFTDVDDDLFINEKIKAEYDDILADLDITAKQTTVEYEDEKAKVVKSYHEALDDLNSNKKSKNSNANSEEKTKEDLIKEQLKSIRLEIITAEKKNNFSLVSKLMKQYDKVEKSLSNGKSNSSESNEATQILNRIRLTASNQVLEIEKKYATDMNRINYNIALEKIKFDEAKILYKIKSDHNGLEDDLITNKNRLEKLREFVDMKVVIGSRVNEFKLQLRLAELQIMKDNELHELTLIDEFRELLTTFKKVENSRTLKLKQILNSYQLIKTEQEYQVNKTIEDIKLTEELHNIEKTILKKQNETVIKNEIIKRETLSEILYQETLVDIAKKEHELTLISIQSPIEEEIIEVEEQADSITEDETVNDENVLATLEKQLEIAEQQIAIAQSVFNTRIESISFTLKQDLDAANSKIATLRQKYDLKKAEVRKELENESEDLNFKLMLFTDEKDHQEITQKLSALTAEYDQKIADITKVENEDEELIQYKKIIEDAKNKAKADSQEATQLKLQTITSFELLHKQTKEKYDALTQSILAPETKEPLPTAEQVAEPIIATQPKSPEDIADETLKLRTAEPLKIISEKKELLENLANSNEIELFIKEQVAYKDHIVSLHDSALEALLLERDNHLDSYAKDLDAMAQNQAVELEQLRVSLLQTIMYRNVSDIEQDYVELTQKEHDIYSNHIAELETYKEEYIKREEKTSKSLTAMISASLVPYKEYIDYASKGLVATKKDLEREYDKLLQQNMNELNNRFKRDDLL